jgi:20S proteasome alpha/beta subunit
MTVVVAFLCTDGIVLAADSMITPSLGNINVGHHHGLKVTVLAGDQVFAFAGDQGQAMRVKIIADNAAHAIATFPHPIDYGVAIAEAVINQFTRTSINGSIDVNTVLGFPHLGAAACCVFEGAHQPRLLDTDHFYVALGSGKLSADPFLRFVVDIFCRDGQPSVRDAIFLATWVISHVIETNPGGVAGPIRMVVLEEEGGNLTAKELPEDEIDEHKQAVESATEALRDWRDQLLNGPGDEPEADPPPPPPAPPPRT